MSTNSVAAVTTGVGVTATLPTVGNQPAQSAQTQGSGVAANQQSQPGQGSGATGVQTPGGSNTIGGGPPVQQAPGTDGKGQAGGQSAKNQPSKDQVAQAVASVNDHLNQLRSLSLQFSTDEQSGHMVIKLMDTTTNTVVRQIPPEYLLNLADNVGKTKGWLVEEKA